MRFSFYDVTSTSSSLVPHHYIVGWTQSTYGNGIRSSATSSYIDPFTSRPNLDVLVNTVVTRVIKTGRDILTGLPIFSGVEVAQSETCTWSPNSVGSLTSPVPPSICLFD